MSNKTNNRILTNKKLLKTIHQLLKDHKWMQLLLKQLLSKTKTPTNNSTCNIIRINHPLITMTKEMLPSKISTKEETQRLIQSHNRLKINQRDQMKLLDLQSNRINRIRALLESKMPPTSRLTWLKEKETILFTSTESTSLPSIAPPLESTKPPLSTTSSLLPLTLRTDQPGLLLVTVTSLLRTLRNPSMLTRELCIALKISRILNFGMVSVSFTRSSNLSTML